MKKTTFLWGAIFSLLFNFHAKAQVFEGFFEGFEDGFPPEGWAIFGSALGVEDWVVNQSNPYEGSNSAHIMYEAAVADTEDWMVTSQIDLTNATNAELRFYTRQEFDDDYGTVYQIRISTGSQTAPADFDTLITWDENELNDDAQVYEEKIVDLSEYDGEVIYIAFVRIQNDGDSWYIDNVSVGQFTLGLEDVETPVVEFSYFPNPVEDVLNIKSPSVINDVLVFNSLGQQVLKLSPNEMNSQIDLSNLHSGAYFVQASILDKVETFRILKK
ncbi:T9SS-dependent choice-of-anchor J family protein [Mangrovimonas sp. YM274]|uniref:T9SS-dependent choice-of-anchor J family protein n=1 Tax=Mangrovimonas sp. YM274 TaxID=3070660 RepID=UPI0027DB7E3C|nr:choice-of-anchor J domain-containing protein [Mangrovimonas sp. YM274]WMI67601.1 choice-of-anchor J domain-containing protein [Mangrovimonas sp. YM274]